MRQSRKNQFTVHITGWLAATIFLMGSALAAGEFNPDLHQTRCKNIRAVAQEAVQYSLLGAWEPYTTKACFKGKRYRYFNPHAAYPEGDLLNADGILFFKQGRDSFKIKNVRKIEDEYSIDVEFKIKGKSLKTVYNYVPDPKYTGRTGICGFVTNSQHKIVRSDCVDQKKLKIPAAKL